MGAKIIKIELDVTKLCKKVKWCSFLTHSVKSSYVSGLTDATISRIIYFRDGN